MNYNGVFKVNGPGTKRFLAVLGCLPGMVTPPISYLAVHFSGLDAQNIEVEWKIPNLATPQKLACPIIVVWSPIVRLRMPRKTPQRSADEHGSEDNVSLPPTKSEISEFSLQNFPVVVFGQRSDEFVRPWPFESRDML